MRTVGLVYTDYRFNNLNEIAKEIYIRSKASDEIDFLFDRDLAKQQCEVLAELSFIAAKVYLEHCKKVALELEKVK